MTKIIDLLAFIYSDQLQDSNFLVIQGILPAHPACILMSKKINTKNLHQMMKFFCPNFRDYHGGHFMIPIKPSASVLCELKFNPIIQDQEINSTLTGSNHDFDWNFKRKTHQQNVALWRFQNKTRWLDCPYLVLSLSRLVASIRSTAIIRTNMTVYLIILPYLSIG